MKYAKSTSSLATIIGLATTSLAAADSPTPPQELRASVYSSTSAELFWDQPTTPGLLYEVRLDGNIIATTDGVSFLTNDLTSQQNHRFEITTIDNTGRRSESAVVDVNGQGLI